MKQFIYLCFMCALLLNSKTGNALTVLDIEVSGHFENQSLKSVLAELESRYDIKFSYIDQLVDNKKITANFEKQALSNALNAIFAGTNLSYKMNNNSRIIVIMNAKQQSMPKSTLHGFVYDAATKEPLIGTNISCKGTTIGTITNHKGFYVLPKLPPGEYTICFQQIGYKKLVINQKLEAGKNHEHNILLEIEPIQFEETIISTDRYNRELDIKPGQISFTTRQLYKIPQAAEPDLFRSIQMLPGVATLSDFAAGLYIRGGSLDQNLILLDQIDVYNPNHLFGFFSTFNTDAIKSVELLKGGYPAKYGGRLSSVLNVFNKEGNREQFQGIAKVGFISTNATLEGPWKMGSWMISGRRTYLDLVTKMFDFNLPYYFYDGHAKINFDIDKNNQASFSIYTGKDVLDFSQGGMSVNLDWGNNTFSAQWSHLFSGNMFSHFVFAGSQFISFYKLIRDDATLGTYNKINDLTLKGTFTYSASTRHTIDFGFDSKRLNLHLDYDVVQTTYKNSNTGTFVALFLQDNYRLGPYHILQTGLRLNYYSDGDYLRLTPRLSIQRIIDEHNKLTFSYGRYSQFLNLVQQESFVFPDMWFSVDETFEPGEADHYIVGYSFDNQKTFSLNIEGFYKQYRNISEYRTNRRADETLDNMTASDNFFCGDGNSYGVDFFLRHNFLGLEGWIGYSLSWSKKQVYGYNNDKEYYPNYDRRHTITAIQDYRLNKKWRMNFAFKFGSGQPYTEAIARYEAFYPNGKFYYTVIEGEKNIYRLPAYHRLDIGIFRKTTIFHKDSEIYLQIINVYNRKNVLSRHYQNYTNPSIRKDTSMLPFVPTIGVSIKF